MVKKIEGVPLDAFMQFNIHLKLWGPELRTVLKVLPHQWSFGLLVILFDTPQDAVCPLGCQETLLTHIESTVNQHPPIPFWLLSSHPLPLHSWV